MGVYYVPFAELVDGGIEPKEALLSACLRWERVALVGDSGRGKSSAAVDRLFEHYRQGIRNELRGVLRTAHTALTAACDMRLEFITPELVDDAVAQWET